MKRKAEHASDTMLLELLFDPEDANEKFLRNV
jgi:hypothetical protein